MLSEAATEPSTITPFNKHDRTGVSTADNYAAFAAKIEEYKMAIYEN